jgi:serine acetyltransferase
VIPVTVSVVITCYNYGRYLSGAIDSVLEQTYSDFEIILVDDGSTDDTEQVAGSYLHNPRIQYIRQENAGQANAKNTGIRHSTGELIAFLDADDRWCPDKLAKQIPCFSDSEVGVVYSLARYIDEEGKEFNYKRTSPYLQPRRGKVSTWLILDNFVQFSSSVVRKECFEKFGVFDESLKMGIDWDLWLRISTGYAFDFVDEQLFYYRVGHAGQMSKNIEVRQECTDRIMKQFFKKFPGVVDKKTYRAAYYLTFCTRGDHFRFLDKKKSYMFFLKAVLTLPFNKDAYKGIVKNLIRYNLDINEYTPPAKGVDMKLQEYLYVVASDLYRYCAEKSLSSFLRSYFVFPGFKFSFWLRTARYLEGKTLLLPLYVFARFRWWRIQYKYGICIPYRTQIDRGFYINYFGGIVICADAVIGKNCNLNPGVTVGAACEGQYPGSPVIGDNVYIGPGGSIIGGIEIGDNVAVGSNAVINEPIPNNAVVACPPGQIKSYKGSSAYVINTVC